MKTLEQLGISPAPWSVDEHNNIRKRDGHTLAVTMVSDAYGHDRTKNDARLIAAAPDMYEALREAILAECIGCRYCGPHPKYECDNHDCRQAPAKWRAALAKAAGESEVKNGN